MAAILASPPSVSTQMPTRPSAAHADHTELGERADQPLLQIAHETAEVHAPARREIEHDVGHPLTRPVIGVLAAAARLEDRQARRIEQVVGFCALVPAV